MCIYINLKKAKNFWLLAKPITFLFVDNLFSWNWKFFYWKYCSWNSTMRPINSTKKCNESHE